MEKFAADYSINKCSNKLKKLLYVVQSTNKKILRVKKLSVPFFPVKKILEKHLTH